jgi:hypothetical protein
LKKIEIFKLKFLARDFSRGALKGLALSAAFQQTPARGDREEGHLEGSNPFDTSVVDI